MMIQGLQRFPRVLHRACSALVLFAVAVSSASTAVPAVAQSPIPSPVRRLSMLPSSTAARVELPGTLSRHVATSQLMGHVRGEAVLNGMSLELKPTAAQDAALTQLLKDQQDPTSPSYRKWLTSEQFGQRFGIADSDLTILKNWLQTSGFTVDSVAPSRNRIVFSGTASAVESAFGVTMQRYQRNGQSFFENNSAIKLPASLSDIVSNVTGLSSYQVLPPHAKRLPMSTAQLTANYNSSTSTSHYLVPWDFKQIFSINKLAGSGYDGTGIKIAVLGQTSVDPAQLTFFQQKTGQTVKLPTMMQVPNTGTSGKLSSNDEGESELDLEYASGSAPGATILFVYTGLGDSSNGTNGNNNGVFDAMTYAVTNNVAPIITLSYGGCEADYSASNMEATLRQANAQGQTVMVSSGDAGSATCDQDNTGKVAFNGLAVSYPASSPYVTAVGGTTLSEGTGSFWSSTNNSFAGSAIGYIPEVVWNDTATMSTFSATGGGYSKLFSKPSWQAMTGVPTDGHRDVPDVAFPSGVQHDGYLICDVQAPCTNSTVGFATGGGGIVGGTSAAAPNFAAMLAVVEQANGGGPLGNINPSLYTLASGSSGSSIFHDITSGNNVVSCTVGTVDCTTGTMGYTAGVGYDQTTGLGSIDAQAFQSALKALPSAGLKTPTVVVATSSSSPTVATPVTFTAVVSDSSSTAPTGTVTFSVDGTVVGTATALTTSTTNNAVATATYTYAGFAAAGNHTVAVAYSGDAVYASGSASFALTAAVASTGSTGFTLSAQQATVTVSSGSNATEQVSVISSNGFSSQITFSSSILSSTGATFSGCQSAPTVTPSANQTVSVGIVYPTTASACSSAGIKRLTSSENQSSGMTKTALAVLTAGLFGLFGLRRKNRLGSLLALVMSLVAMGMSGCGGGSGSSTTTPPTTTASSGGSYVIQITGKSGSVSATTQFTLKVQ